MNVVQASGPEGREIRVRGLVQGVGFRPTVWRLARDCALTGEVYNDAEGVMIRAWGAADALERFTLRLRAERPPLARVDTIESIPLDGKPPDVGFEIIASHGGPVRTGVVADAATCPACRDETLKPANRRYRYPFTNCTLCGPRLTIIRTIPYDRAHTSMASFAMCPDCQAEYDNPADRRFHAQPNACRACGPRITLERVNDEHLDWTQLSQLDEVDAAASLLLAGEIIAVKGLGGFHFACDACKPEVVARLRERKRRYDKPFALMARDLDVIRRYCKVSSAEAAVLESSHAPIVLLTADGGECVAGAVAPNQQTLGFMLPYTPLHHLLLQLFERPIVLTSGNLSDEPQCIDNDEAGRKLTGIADYVLSHDRAIVNRLDDSVARLLDGKPRLLRRARGYAPAPLPLPDGFEAAPPLLAFGGELKNTFCLLKDGQAIVSQHMGDLENAAVFADYRKNLDLYRELYAHHPDLLAVDLHPEYLSSKLGREQADREDLILKEVQHHHAHIASCLAENAVTLDAAPVLGLALDGLGYGEDGTLWGGECLLADYRGYRRLARFKPVAMIGGAQAIREPWRNTYAHLCAALGWEYVCERYGALDLVKSMRRRPLATLDRMIELGVNSPPASSCGRLFDAVAAALGVCPERAGYEGQAAIELEALVDEQALKRDSGYSFELTDVAGMVTLDPAPMWRALLDDLARAVSVPLMSARFHRSLADALIALMAGFAETYGLDTAALSGGVFQNRILFERVSGGLRNKRLAVLSHSAVPANDGGLALGQAAVAAARVLENSSPQTKEIPLAPIRGEGANNTALA